jgi:hypothetical protein
VQRSPERFYPEEEALKDKPYAPISDPLGLGVSIQGKGRIYAAYPSLRRARWLFPVGRKETLRAGIRELFHPRSLKGRAFQAAMYSGGFRGQRVSLAEEPLGDLERELTLLLGEEVSLGFYVGSPGAYRKSTALVLDATGRTLAFARIASNVRTQTKTEAERRNLLRLSGCPELHGRVPRVLGHFDWNGNEVLAISGGPPWPGPDHLTESHLDFYQKLFEFSSFGNPDVPFAESPMYSRLSDTLSRIEFELPEEASGLMQRALDLLHESLGDVRVPLSMAHRDFAPWNTRVGPMGLFVFDWDYATDSATPLYDFFHFREIQSALDVKRTHSSYPERVGSALERIWPEGRPHLPWLYLAYLLDVSLIYGEARVLAPDEGEDRVWQWFLDRIRDFLDNGSPF